jgi:hypothetical protein
MSGALTLLRQFPPPLSPLQGEFACRGPSLPVISARWAELCQKAPASFANTITSPPMATTRQLADSDLACL